MFRTGEMQMSTGDVSARDVAQKKILNRIDPLFWILDRLIFEGLFRPLKKNTTNEYEILDLADSDFLVENLYKHRLILWLNLLAGVYLAVWGLDQVFASPKAELVIGGLLAPALITGAA